MTLKPATINFTLGNGLAIYKGSSWKVSIGVEEDGKPYDLTGYVGKCSIKEHTGDEEPILEPKVVIGDNGNFDLILSSEETSTLPTNGKNHYEVSTYQYDVYFIEDEEYYRTLQGFVDVSPTITEEND